MTMCVYMDEANTHDAGRYMAVSAAYATPTVWASWVQSWLPAIQPLAYFHAVELSNGTGQCEGWDQDRRVELVKRCLPIIRDHRIWGKVAVFDKHALAAKLAHRPDAMQKLKHAYFAALIWNISFVFKLAKTVGEKDLMFFHEENPFEVRARQHFESMKVKAGFPDATLNFCSKLQAPQLQCADIYAYEGFKQFEFDPTLVKIRKPWLTINGNGLLVSALHAEDDTLQQLADALVDYVDG